MKKRITISIIFNLIALSYVIITKYTGLGIACPLEAMTGYYCLFCGCTRSTLALLDGNLLAAYYYNPMYFLLLPYFILKYIEITYHYIKNNTVKITSDIIYIIIAAFIYMFFRNYGLTFLKPYLPY